MLHEGERQYLTSPGGCDCGTVLAGRAPSAEALEAELAKTAAKLRRRDWSEGKIARAVEGYRKAAGRDRAPGADSLALWAAIVEDLKARLGLPGAGLFLHWYRGDPATESFAPSAGRRGRGRRR